MANKKKFEVQFLQDYTVNDDSGDEYIRGKSYKLHEDSAAHFINRKVAVLVPADGKLPAGVTGEIAKEVAAMASADASKLAQDAKDNAAQAVIDAQGKVETTTTALEDAKKAQADLADDAPDLEKTTAADAVKTAEMNAEQAATDLEAAEQAAADLD